MRSPSIIVGAAQEGDLPPSNPKAGSGSVASIRGATTVLGDLAVNAGGRGLSALLSLATVLIATRILGPGGYGTFAIVVVAATLARTASSVWLGVSVRRYGREELELRGSMSRLTWNRAIVAAPIFVSTTAVVVALKLGGALPPQLGWSLVWIAIGTALTMVVVEHWVCLLETGGKLKLSAATQLISQAMYVGALAVAFGIGLRGSPRLVLVAGIGSACVFIVGLLPSVWGMGIVPRQWDRQLLRRMLWLSTPMIALALSQYVFASVDLVAIRIFRSQADVGVYAVAYQSYATLSAMAISLNSVLLPLFVSLRRAGRSDLIQRYLRSVVPQGIFVISTLGGVLVPLVPLVVPAIFGHAFLAAAAPLAVLAVATASGFAMYFAVPILDLEEKTRAATTINLIAMTINVVGDAVLLGALHMGIVAPAIATSIAALFMFLAFYAMARRLLQIEDWLPPILAAPLISGLFPTLIMGDLAGAAVGVTAATVAALAIVRWRTPFHSEDRDFIAALSWPDAVKRVALRAVALASGHQPRCP